MGATIYTDTGSEISTLWLEECSGEGDEHHKKVFYITGGVVTGGPVRSQGRCPVCASLMLMNRLAREQKER